MEGYLFGLVGVKTEFFKKLAIGAAKLPGDGEVGSDCLSAVECKIIVVKNLFAVNGFIGFIAFVKEVYAALVGCNLVDFNKNSGVLRTVGDSNTLTCNGAEACGGNYKRFVGGNFVLIVTPITKVSLVGFFVDGENFALCVCFKVLCVMFNGIFGSDCYVCNNVVFNACI